MFVIESICDRNVFFVPAIVSSLGTSKKENGDSPRVEGVENPVWPAPILNPELPHVPVPGSGDLARLGERELGASLLQEPDYDVDGILFFSIECDPPPLELIRVLYVPGHDSVCRTTHMPSTVWTPTISPPPRLPISHRSRLRSPAAAPANTSRIGSTGRPPGNDRRKTRKPLTWTLTGGLIP